MSLLNKLKYAFGLDSGHDLEDDEDFKELPDATVNRREPESPTAHNVDNGKKTSVQTNTPQHTATNDDDAIDAIFEHVVSTFNIALPDFLRKSVDPEAQRKYLYNTLKSDLQHYLKGLSANAESKYRELWNAERDKLLVKLRETERQAAEYGDKNKELRQNLLSADRQKRALSTRSAELEKQILTLEADREQRDLESKSMANKVKAVQVYEKEIEEMRQQINELTSQLDVARKEAAAAQQDDKQPVGDANLIAELRKKLAEADQKIAEADRKTAEADRKSAEAVRKMADADKRVNQLSQQLKAQADDFGARLRRQADEITALRLENEKAKSAPAQPKAEQKVAESANKDSDNKSVANNSQQNRDNKQRRQRPSDPMIDDILGDTEWIVSPSSSKRKGKDSDRARHNDNDDRQMSLF